MDNECLRCGFYDTDYEGCTCPSTDKWYACPMSDPKPEDFGVEVHDEE